TPAYAVSGVVTGPEGSVANLGVRLTPVGGNKYGSGTFDATALTATDAVGRFTFPAVPTGQYALTAIRVPRQAVPAPPPPPPPPPPPGAARGVAVPPLPAVPALARRPASTPAALDPVTWAEETVSVADGD